MTIKDLRMQITEDQIKSIMAKKGVFPVFETETAIIFPTVCHNIEGGSPKLYYYKNDKIFRCYTGCKHMFDIFELIIKMDALYDITTSLPAAIEFTGVKNQQQNFTSKLVIEDLKYLERLKGVRDLLEPIDESEISEANEVRTLDKNLINSFLYNEVGLSPWIEEGISPETLHKYNIKYDSTVNAIVIPNLNHEGELIGIRGRFLGKDAKAKYMPLKINNQILSHPTGKFLYGYFENKANISRKGIAIIFEGEKSVLKMDTYYPNNNVSLATAGQRITLDHLDALLKLNINEVVLAYDKEYRNREEREKVLAEYEQITQILQPYFQVTIIIDFADQLKYKDSPIDRGKEIFEDLMRTRIKR